MRWGSRAFFDLDRRLEAISAKGDPLEALNALVPFESFRAEIEAVVRLAAEERKSNAGRKPFDAVNKKSGEYLFVGRRGAGQCMTTRQYCACVGPIR
jgi:hypothetical protein